MQGIPTSSNIFMMYVKVRLFSFEISLIKSRGALEDIAYTKRTFGT